ncbi:subtilase-type protease inhibitor [Streptomyces sp. NPDC059011]|uniref:subtilase-type protease inhibitor n=1 Tax=unclassified Streptomyces TaxID=2593676 RepID=UPI003687FA51
MRKTVRRAAGGATLAFALLGSTAGVAHGAPATLYAPSALVLTTAHGQSTATSPERAVILTCAPGTTGTHPASDGACAALARVKGEFGSLGQISRGQPRICTREYNPVTVTAKGIWQGKRVSYEHTFANECVKSAEGAAVFEF